ncbi:MAG: flagellar export chaperone FlgN [Deltaproteobacteria bacterium]|nr:flagellar export chaperone FlgN [Deltaproteobacteria bacterium]
MEKPTSIEELYRRRLGLLEELRRCLEQEADSLAGPDLDGLWGLIRRKRELTSAIDEVNEELRTMGQGASGPEAFRILLRDPGFSDLKRRTAQLREEIKLRVLENVAFIGETVQFLDELIGCITSRGDEEPTYRRLGGQVEGRGPALILREA